MVRGGAVYLSSNTGGDTAVIMEGVSLGLTGVHHFQADLEASIVDDPVVSVLQHRAVVRGILEMQLIRFFKML